MSLSGGSFADVGGEAFPYSKTVAHTVAKSCDHTQTEPNPGVVTDATSYLAHSDPRAYPHCHGGRNQFAVSVAYHLRPDEQFAGKAA